jgi:fused signal recognition particle receptor
MDTGTIIAVVIAVLVLATVIGLWVARRQAPEKPHGEALPPEPRREEPSAAPKTAAEKRITPEAKPEKVAAKQGAVPQPVAVEKAPEQEKAPAAKPPEEPKLQPSDKQAAPQGVSAEPARPVTEPPGRLKEKPDGREQIAAMRRGLASTRGGFIARLAAIFGNRKEIDPSLLDEIQEVLLTADIGIKTSEKLLAALRERMQRNELRDEQSVWSSIREEARKVLSTGSASSLGGGPSPRTIVVVGVNGVGKTTTIGKLASRFHEQGLKVVLAAGDTFRAAAVLQLEVWARRVGCEIIKGKDRADPASVIFEAIKKAQSDRADVVIADTAGRLHTKSNLMEELKKVVRTAEKALERPIDEILLVLDSTTGQNAIQQAQLFKEAIPVNGIVLTKLDGTAKGGVVLGIVDEHHIPVRYIGIGERVEDLREFDPDAFVQVLFTKSDEEIAAA